MHTEQHISISGPSTADGLALQMALALRSWCKYLHSISNCIFSWEMNFLSHPLWAGSPYPNPTIFQSHYPNFNPTILISIPLSLFQSHYPLFNPTLGHQSHSFTCIFIIPLLLFVTFRSEWVRTSKNGSGVSRDLASAYVLCLHTFVVPNLQRDEGGSLGK